jgi:hypothetical protein
MTKLLNKLHFVANKTNYAVSFGNDVNIVIAYTVYIIAYIVYTQIQMFLYFNFLLLTFLSEASGLWQFYSYVLVW